MKKQYLLLYLLLLFISFNLYAQQQTNHLKLAKLAEFYKNKAQLDKQLALSKAKLKNWKIKLNNPDGSYAELIRLDTQGNPVYYKTYNLGAGITTRANQLYTGGSLGLQIEGQNMIIGEWDGGSVRATHEALSGRVTQMDTPSSSSAHSTHVAGTMIASDQVAGGNARGMAFQASVHAYDWNDDISEMATAANNGLLISNHSYGYGWPAQYQFGKYDYNSVAFDEIMYNAPYYIAVCAAGNSRGYGVNTGDNGYDLLSGHSCSKNSMIVAAVHEVLNYTGPGSVQMSSFSSWGPTDDGRIKPDISAKGVNVYSCTDVSNTSYDSYDGTSMASPSVAGTLLLLQQYYHQLNNTYMRASSLRGLAIHTADEAGTSPGPDYAFGWGLINAEKAAEVIRDNGLTSLISEETLNNGSTYSITVEALGNEPLIGSICWTDPAGAEVTDTTEDLYVKSLVNDLDIRITHNGVTYYPWKLDINNMSAPATHGDNDVDNIEKIQIDNPSGSYTITVTHKGTLTNNQNFSLILSGIAFNDFYITSNASDTQIICSPVTTTNFDLHLTTIAGFNGNVNFITSGLPASVNASFSPSSLSSSGDFQLTLSNLDNLAPGNYPFIIHGTSGTDVVDFNATLRILDSNFPVQNLNTPADNAHSIAINPTLTWETNSNAEEYQLQVAGDSSFNNIITDITTSQTSYPINGLNYHTSYYWRVKPKNSCSNGNFSTIYTFVTQCQEPQNISAGNLLLDSVELDWNDPNAATQWEIEVVETGSNPTGSGIIVSAHPYTFTGLNSATQYKAYIRSICSSEYSAWGESGTFTTASDFCAGDHFYDSGGPSGNYANNENQITTIAPSTGYNTVSVTFNSFNLESGFDYLRIYDGNDLNAPFIGEYTGSNNPGTITSNNPSGSLTFKFTSDGSVTHSGWDASVTCLNITCPNPGNLSVSNILPDSVDISWVNGGNENQWQIEYGLSGFNLGSGSLLDVDTNPFSLTGLNSNTGYDVYLRANCGTNPGDDDSNWIGPVSFTTACSLFSTPFFDDVENHPATSSASIENCWSAVPENTSNYYRWNITDNGTTPSSSTGPSSAHSGNKFFFTEASSGNLDNEAELITPLIDISMLTTPYLSFYYHMYGSAMGSLHVDIMSNGNWHNDEIIINGEQQTSENDPWLEQGLVINYPGPVKIRFRGIRGNNYRSDIAIDDIRIDEMPTCPVPTNFTVNNIGLNSAEFNWDAGYNETTWQLEYGFTGFTLGFGTQVITNTKPYTLSGLTFNNGYDIYLRAICGANPGDDDSYWVGPLHFNTLDIQTPQNLTGSLDQNSGIVNLNWDNVIANVNSPSALIRYNIYRNGTQIGISTTNSYTDNLTAYGNYSYYVTALYNEGESGSSNTVSFDYIGTPDISVNPTSLSETLEQGQTSVQYLTISNSGDADLTYYINRNIITTTSNTSSTGVWNLQGNAHSIIAENTPQNMVFDYDIGTYSVPHALNNILVYDIDNIQHYKNALINLNLSFTEATNESLLVNELTNNNWDLVVINQYSNSLNNSSLDAINNYVSAGGKLIFSYWNAANSASHPLYNNIGINIVQNFNSPYNISAINSNHPIFTTPNTINNFPWTQDQYATSNGQIINLTTGSQALASFNNSNHTTAISLYNNAIIFNAFGSNDFQADNNNNGKTDILELIENEINYMNSGAGSWLYTLPVSGSVAPGNSIDVAVHFDASDLTAGVYNANLDISNNDPNTPHINVPVTLNVTAASCPWPTDLTATVTGTDVELSWTNGGSETQWELEYGISGFSQGSGTLLQVNTNPYTLSNLNPNTNYDIYIRAICGSSPGSDDSVWRGPVSFRTTCNTFNSPFIENVENHPATISADIDNCWSTFPNNTENHYRWNVSGNGTTPSSGTGPDQAYSGTQYFYTEASRGAQGDVAELYTPFIDIANLSSPELSFFYFMYGYGMGSLHIDVYSNGTWTNDVDIISGEQQNAGNVPWLIKEIPLGNFSSPVRIRFRSFRGSNFHSDMAIDNIYVGEAPTCPAPNSLNYSNLQIDSVTLDWINGGSETQWIIEYGATGFTPGNGTQLIVNNHPYTLTGLNSSTDYDVYVRAICGSNPGSDDSFWTGPVNFTTLQDYCSGDHFYDSGGPSGNYSNSENTTTTICPTNGYDFINVNFLNFNLESGYDYLYIYDGNNTNAPLIGQYTGSNSPGNITANNPTGCLTFHFTSDGSVTRSGWEAEINCISLSCPAPANLSASNIGDDSAEISWTNGGSESQWQIEYGISGFTQGNGTYINANTNPFTLNNLNPSTNYDVYLRAVCGANPGIDDSVWIGPVSFTTLCNTIAPYLENVEAHPVTNYSIIENCWTSVPYNNSVNYRWNVSDSQTPSPNTGPNAAHSGTHFFYTEASDPAVTGEVAELISSPINISGLTYPELSFYYFMYGINTGDLHVDLYYNNTWHNAVLTLSGQQQTSGNDNWLKASINLNNTADIITIRFRAIRGNGHAGDISLDDIAVDEGAGIDKLSGLYHFNYYPNPTGNYLKINADKPVNSIVIQNLLGQKIREIKAEKTQLSIDLKDLKPGTYLLIVKIDNQLGHYKFIKK